MAAAVRIATPRAARPTPSRRCAGSRSLAFRPKARTVAPTVCARAIQAPLSTRTIQPTRITTGLAGGGGAAPRRPFRRLAAAVRPPRCRGAGLRPDAVLPVLRAEFAGRGRPAVPLLRRAAALGARVAMISTVSANPAQSDDRPPCVGPRPRPVDSDRRT